MRIRLHHRCILCKAVCHAHFRLCDACHHDLPWIGIHCLYCGLPIPGEANRVCGQCIKHNPHYDTILSPFYYQSPISNLISLLKFNNELGIAKVLAKLITPSLQAYYGNSAIPEAIIPIPLHDKRLYDRGFNQAIEVGKFLSKALGIPFSRQLSKRTRYTPPQHTLDKKQRKGNLKNAFEIHLPTNIAHVAVLDDVITTATTMDAFCQALKKHGVKKIDVWSIARTVINSKT